MSLTQALSTAASGMRATQTGLSIVAANVANAETPGYVRKTVTQVSTAAGAVGMSVRVAAINRELDQFLQRQMRVESSGAGYAGLRADFYARLQSLYGAPGTVGTLENTYNEFMGTLQALATSPESAAARSAVINAAQLLSQQLNVMTTDVQGLRADAEHGLADAITRANDAMARIAQINRHLATATAGDATTASLLDQRDVYIDQLAQLMDINVIRGDHNQLSVFTNSGIELVGNSASTLVFDAQGSMSANAHWSVDPTKRGVGTIMLKAPNGADVDLIASGAIRSGKIAALIEMRDDVLVQAQTQLDEVAAGLARALSDRTVDGTVVAAGAQSGFDIDVGSLLNGNSVRVVYTDNLTGAQRAITLVRADTPGVLRLPNSATSDPNDKVVGVDFSGGMASVISQLTAALGATGLQFSNPAGQTLRILDDGGFNRIDIDAVSATYTVSTLTAGTAELPFFVDGNAMYTGAITPDGSQRVGFAGRISVNSLLVADVSKLVVFQTSPVTQAGDPTRPNFLYDRLNTGAVSFSPQSGVGTPGVPFTGPVHAFLRQVLSQQGEAAEAAANLKQGQDVVFNTLQQRLSEGSAVNIDEEMTHLLNLQTSYAANARVLTTVKEMLDALMRI